MSMFEDSRYRWRETYFVLFDARKRPKLNAMTKALTALSNRYELTNLSEDEHGLIDSLTVIAPDDYAALDICYSGEPDVLEQAADLVQDLKKAGADLPPSVTWERIKRFDGRFDILHFEQIPEELEEELDENGMLDPSALLLVINALAKLTGGVAVDPQAGTFLVEE
ncbi:MAG: hypothetical protein NT090_10265 [Acidobacteria bacterium]|nr:hypothetical protein [Acidobacteriota bacterium]